MSVPGSGCTNSSAASAVIVRIGSITTTLAPSARAASMVGHRWRFVSRVFEPQMTISFEWRSSSGSSPRPLPFVMRMPWPTVGPQIARSSRLAPSTLKKRSLRPIIASRLWLPASLNGRTVSPPWRSMTSCRRAAISVSASSHEIGSNEPDPFGPVRRSGCSKRSGLYTRSRKRLTFGHSSPAL